MALKKSLISSSRYSIKCPYSMKPIGICIHNTANDSSAAAEINYMKNNNNEVSFHIAVDDIEAIQGIPLNRNTWHAGDGANGKGNRYYISVEICYSKSGGDRFTKAEKRAIQEVAALCKEYGFTIENIKQHRDFSATQCPHRTNINTFKSEVKKILDSDTKLYRVSVNGKQIGAFKDPLNALKQVESNLKAGEIEITYK